MEEASSISNFQTGSLIVPRMERFMTDIINYYARFERSSQMQTKTQTRRWEQRWGLSVTQKKSGNIEILHIFTLIYGSKVKWLDIRVSNSFRIFSNFIRFVSNPFMVDERAYFVSDLTPFILSCGLLLTWYKLSAQIGSSHLKSHYRCVNEWQFWNMEPNGG